MIHQSPVYADLAVPKKTSRAPFSAKSQASAARKTAGKISGAKIVAGTRADRRAKIAPPSPAPAAAISKSPAKRAQSSARGRRRPAPPTKPLNKDVRSREYLTPDEVARLKDAAKHLGRHGFRDSLLISTMYRHGLRVSEAVNLRWDQVDFRYSKLHVQRLKNGDASVHYLEGEEVRAFRRLQADYPEGDFVFLSERAGPLAARTVHTIVARAGVAAGLPMTVHPHMLRHAKGYQLAARGEDTRAIQGYLGHRNIQHTVLYTKLDPRRYRGFGRD